jgi:hypothetical protein
MDEKYEKMHMNFCQKTIRAHATSKAYVNTGV